MVSCVYLVVNILITCELHGCTVVPGSVESFKVTNNGSLCLASWEVMCDKAPLSLYPIFMYMYMHVYIESTSDTGAPHTLLYCHTQCD